MRRFNSKTIESVSDRSEITKVLTAPIPDMEEVEYSVS